MRADNLADLLRGCAGRLFTVDGDYELMSKHDFPMLAEDLATVFDNLAERSLVVHGVCTLNGLTLAVSWQGNSNIFLISEDMELSNEIYRQD